MASPAPEAACDLCAGGLDAQFEIDGYTIFECQACGHRQLDVAVLGSRDEHVATTYADVYFNSGGAGYPDYLAEGQLFRERGRRYGELLHRRSPTASTVLDVGAAAGFVLAGLGDAGWTGVGVEPNGAMAGHARDVLGLDVRTATLELFCADRLGTSQQRFDAITLIQVIAHFLSPRAALGAAAEVLAPSGLVLIETWDRASRSARLFGRRWHEYSPPSVVHWFTQPELDQLCASAGLVPVASGHLVKWIGAAHAASLLRHRSPTLGRLAGIVPPRLRLPYPSEDLVWRLYRKK